MLYIYIFLFEFLCICRDFVPNSLSDEALDTPGTCKCEVGSSNYSMGTRIKKRLKLAEDELSRQVNETTKSKGNQRLVFALQI